MHNDHPLVGVYAASITPLRADYSPDPGAMPGLMEFFATRGCHGALILGTTGEGPSFSPKERVELMQAASEIRRSHPAFHLLAGTGTPSLDESIELTMSAFDLGYDAVVVLPPYYFRKASDDGLFKWFSILFEKAVPSDGRLIIYHIPPFSGVPISLELLARLKDRFSERFTGIKDSSADAAHAQRLGEQFGNDLLIFNGNDGLFSLALQSQASGCITGMANLRSPLLRQVWDQHMQDITDIEVQSRLNAFREVMDTYLPIPAFVKEILSHEFNFPKWTVRPPLLPLSLQKAGEALQKWDQLLNV
jgi:4-hydroxy-tetrahydrodipicolinate synthase